MTEVAEGEVMRISGASEASERLSVMWDKGREETHKSGTFESCRAMGCPRFFESPSNPEFAYGQAQDMWHLSVSGTLGLRLFVLGSAPSGIYFGPEFSGIYQRRSQEGVLRKAFGVGLGGSVGFTLVLLDRVVLSAGFSAQYRSVPDLEAPGEAALRVELIPTPRLAFGVAF